MDRSWNSRRSNVYSNRAMCASSQPQATRIGCKIIEQGGNAADAIIAMAAALAVTEPCNTGLGGDCFMLYYDRKQRKVFAINGSGRSPANLDYETARDTAGQDKYHINNVTVPGTCHAWCTFMDRFGTMKLKQVFADAIQLAERGYPVAEITAHTWKEQENILKSRGEYGSSLLIDGRRAPHAGEVFKNPEMAKVLRDIAGHGPDVFYNGWIGQSIVDTVKHFGGKLSMDDFRSHETIITEPMTTTYGEKYRMWQVGPNSQGLCTLLALNILEHCPNLKNLGHNSAQYLHYVIEALKIALADGRHTIGDPDQYQKSEHKELLDRVLSKDYAKMRFEQIRKNQAGKVEYGRQVTQSETVYMCCIDEEGNACSMVNSNYIGFGTCVVPRGCGFSLQNRGDNFFYEKGHRNCYASGRRSYHTVIPALVTDDATGELLVNYGVMGGWMQPQGQIQVLFNVILFGMDPQQALDAARVRVDPPTDDNPHPPVFVEEGIGLSTIDALRMMGHDVRCQSSWDRLAFGKGQVILTIKNQNDGSVTYMAGSDPRSDGLALGL